MPVISTFYGIIISMFYFDTKKHKRPHIHARSGEFKAVFAIDDGDILEGDLPRSKLRLVQAWIELHRDELVEQWRLAAAGRQVSRIQPLR